MRIFLVAALLASAASAAIAADPRDRDRGPRSERAEQSDSDSERPRARPQRSERRESRPEPRESRPERRSNLEALGGGDVRPSRRMTVERPSVATRGGGERPERVAEPREVRLGGDDSPLARAQRRSMSDAVNDWRSNERRPTVADSPTPRPVERRVRTVTPDTATDVERRHVRRPPLVDRSGEDLVEPVRPVPRVLDPDRRTPVRRVSRTPVPGTEPPPPRTAEAEVAEPRHRWRRDWRDDRRHDWRDHRRRHRSLFHLGFYFDPFGWRYFRYGIGWRLWPSYYSSHYWLNDPWSYRLPPAYGPYRWIRYYDDALLVNIYTGRVVDVIHDFFW